MSSACVLLNRCVGFSFVDEADDDESSSSAAAVTSMMGGTNKPPFFPAVYQATVAMLASMKPADAVLLQPPEIATFRLRVSESHRGSLSSTPLVACADKGLLVIYGGRYFGPGSSLCGCYLVYDAVASADRLSTVPPAPEAGACHINGIGSGAVVLRCHQPGPSSSAAYLLAELATSAQRKFPDPDDGVLFLWRSDEQPTPRWARKEVHLPREVCWAPDKHVFYSDTSFSGPGGCLCWVDLLRGIVVCTNPWGPEDPELRFIPLPDGCPAVSATDYPYRPRAEEDRSAACVDGRIKLVAMVGILAGWNAHQFRLTTWTLSPDLSGWQQDGVFPLKDLWATEEYRVLNLRQYTPVCPVLSAREDGVVYAIVNDIEERTIYRGRQVDPGTELQFKSQYVIGIDMRRNKIVSTSSGNPPESLMQMMPRLLSIDFCASSLHGGAKDRQVMSADCGCMMLPNICNLVYTRHDTTYILLAVFEFCTSVYE
jgi:hypothetical protein